MRLAPYNETFHCTEIPNLCNRNLGVTFEFVVSVCENAVNEAH